MGGPFPLLCDGSVAGGPWFVGGELAGGAVGVVTGGEVAGVPPVAGVGGAADAGAVDDDGDDPRVDGVETVGASGSRSGAWRSLLPTALGAAATTIGDGVAAGASADGRPREGTHGAPVREATTTTR